MSFGYSVGDIVVLSQLAWKAYKSCNQAPESFAGVSQEALSLHAILRELEETLRESALSESQQQRLKTVCAGPERILTELLALVAKYENLATSTQRMWDRMRYAAEDINDLRNRLISSTVLLTTFLTSTQLAVEQKLRKLLKEVQSGRREPSVFSTSTVDSLSVDDRVAWREIRKALEDVGITPAAFQENRNFILSFLQASILRGEFQELASVELSTPASAALPKTLSGANEELQASSHRPISLSNAVAHVADSKANILESSKVISQLDGGIPASDKSSQPRLPRADRWLRRVRDLASSETFVRRMPRELVPSDQATKVSREIDEYRSAESISAESSRRQQGRKLLMLGAGEAGKSTIMTQLRILYEGDFTTEELKGWRQVLRTNLLIGSKIAIEEMGKCDPPLQFQRESAATEAIEAIRILDDTLDDVISMEARFHLPMLWNEPVFREFVDLGGNGYAQFDNIAYYRDRIRSLTRSNSLPDNDMVLHAYLRTMGIKSTTFRIGDTNLDVVDVGGHRSQRKNWPNLLEDVSDLVFVVSITAYDRCLAEDELSNQMSESLMLFESILSLTKLRDYTTTLFFTKLDLLPEYLKSHPLHGPKTRFPDYGPSSRGLNDETNILQFFIRRFLALNPNQRDIEVHAGDVTNTVSIEPCLRSMVFGRKKGKAVSRQVNAPATACCAASRWIEEGVLFR